MMPLPPIRNKVQADKVKVSNNNKIFDKQDLAQSQGKEDVLKRDITPMFDYYKAWDKFTKDADDDNNDLNQEFEEAKNPTPTPDKVCTT